MVSEKIKVKRSDSQWLHDIAVNSLRKNGYFVDTKLMNANKIELITRKRFKSATIELTTDPRHAGTVKLFVISQNRSILNKDKSTSTIIFAIALVFTIIFKSLLGFILSFILFILYRKYSKNSMQVIKEDQFNFDTFNLVASHLRYTIEQGSSVEEKCWNCFELRDFRSDQCSHCGAK